MWPVAKVLEGNCVDSTTLSVQCQAVSKHGGDRRIPPSLHSQQGRVDIPLHLYGCKNNYYNRIYARERGALYIGTYYYKVHQRLNKPLEWYQLCTPVF